MIVVDTNVLAYFWLRGEHTAAAEAVLRKDPEWVAPLLWRSEFQNILAGYLRRGALDLPVAIELAEKAGQQMRSREYSVGSDDVLTLVADSRCSAYDCEFVALAKALEIPLVTADRAVLAGFPDVAIALSLFVA